MTGEKFDVKDIQQEYYLLTWLSDSSGIVYISIVEIKVIFWSYMAPIFNTVQSHRSNEHALSLPVPMQI